MKRFIVIALLILMLPMAAHAQSATATSHLVWDQPAADLATAQSQTYKHYDDGATTGVALAATFAGAGSQPGTFGGSSPFPAFSPGTHTLTMTASNAAGESGKSSPLSFQFIAIPLIPRNLGIAGVRIDRLRHDDDAWVDPGMFMSTPSAYPLHHVDVDASNRHESGV